MTSKHLRKNMAHGRHRPHNSVRLLEVLADLDIETHLVLSSERATAGRRSRSSLESTNLPAAVEAFCNSVPPVPPRAKIAGPGVVRAELRVQNRGRRPGI